MSVVVKYKESKPIRAIEIGSRLEFRVGTSLSSGVAVVATGRVEDQHCFGILTAADLTHLIDALIDIKIALSDAK